MAMIATLSKALRILFQRNILREYGVGSGRPIPGRLAATTVLYPCGQSIPKVRNGS